MSRPTKDRGHSGTLRSHFGDRQGVFSLLSVRALASASSILAPSRSSRRVLISTSKWCSLICMSWHTERNLTYPFTQPLFKKAAPNKPRIPLQRLGKALQPQQEAKKQPALSVICFSAIFFTPIHPYPHRNHRIPMQLHCSPIKSRSETCFSWEVAWKLR